MLVHFLPDEEYGCLLFCIFTITGDTTMRRIHILLSTIFLALAALACAVPVSAH
jgi:hypothetical protein